MKQEIVEIMLTPRRTIQTVDGVDYEMSGWQFTDATRHMACSRCSAAPGAVCRQPDGRKAYFPHIERTKAFVEKFGTSSFTGHPT